MLRHRTGQARPRFDFECAAVHADRTAIMSRHFPGNFFTV